MRNATFLFSALLILAGCGRDVPTGRSSLRILSDKYSSNPERMYRQVQSCEIQSFNASQTALPLRLFLQGEEKVLERDFDGLIDGLFLRDPQGKILGRTVYGEEFDLTENVVRGNVFVQIDGHRPGKELTLCPEVSQYEPDTYEAAALNAAHYIKVAYDKVTTAKSNFRLPPVNLQVGTIMKIRERKFEPEGVHIHNKYLVDNALYFPDLQSIIFVPHSPEMRHTGFQNHYWQVPTIINHEYGHHIFHALAPLRNNLQTAISDCFSTRADYGISSAEVLNDGEVDVSQVIAFLNEGFADLIAFYTLPAQERSVEWIPFLHRDRDVMSPTFALAETKTFGDTSLRIFFSRRNPNERPAGFTVNYRDIHVMGAIFAHQANKFMSGYVYRDDIKLRILLEWANQLGKKNLQGSSPRQALELAMEDFVRLTVKELGRKYDRFTCRNIQELYPFTSGTFPECSSFE